MSVGRKKLSVCQNNVAAFSCCCKDDYIELLPLINVVQYLLGKAFIHPEVFDFQTIRQLVVLKVRNTKKLFVLGANPNFL